MELDFVRKQINIYDNVIKNMINLRMALIPIVADIKIKNDIPFFQGKREEEIYSKIEVFAKENGVDSDLVKNIYKLMIANAIGLEEAIAEKKIDTVIKENVDFSRLENSRQEFEKLEAIMEKEIPEILSQITKACEVENLNVNQMATLYYYEKMDK